MATGMHVSSVEIKQFGLCHCYNCVAGVIDAEWISSLKRTVSAASVRFIKVKLVGSVDLLI